MKLLPHPVGKESYIIYGNGRFFGTIPSKSPKEAISFLDKKYSAEGINWIKDLSIRIFRERVITYNKTTKIKLFRFTNKGKPININSTKAKHWEIRLKYKNKKIIADILDSTDITIYALWESIKRNLNIDLNKEISKIDFKVELIKGKLSQKAKLVLFFSNKANCKKLWKYNDLREAMKIAGLEMVGRGIEGERPRELRYAMGYSFITSEKDKKVPDGHCLVLSPFPFGSRNERRNATLHLDKKNWSELQKILKNNPKRLRCGICGLFEGETNRIGQETKFQKGHLISHLSGGNISKSNMFAICQYCNTDQLNLFDIDSKTGKKIWNLIPVISRRDYRTKLEIFRFLKKHLKKVDVS